MITEAKPPPPLLLLLLLLLLLPFDTLTTLDASDIG